MTNLAHNGLRSGGIGMPVLFLSRSDAGWQMRHLDAATSKWVVQPTGLPLTIGAIEAYRLVRRKNPNDLVAIEALGDWPDTG